LSPYVHPQPSRQLQRHEPDLLLRPRRRELADVATIRGTITATVWLPLVSIVLAAMVPFDGRAAEARAVKGAEQQVLRVGPTQQYTRPSQAARAARDGALVEIYSGEYEGDVAVWRQNDLTLRGVGERPHLRAGGRAAEGKAIWVIKGDRVTVENVELSGARVPSRNGAAIRAEGAGLTIRNCRFHQNEMGLLTNPSPNSVVIIEDSEIDRNTTETERHGRLGHNIYVHRARLFILRNSYVHGARIGHQVKTWAQSNEIRENRIHDGDGWGSLLLDISNGGQAEVINNHFQQSARSGNRTAIGFAGEAVDRSSSDHALRVEGNSFINEGGAATFVRNHTSAPVLLKGNRLPVRGVTPLRGPGHVE
jgi:Right handed beta helix region